MIKKHIAIIQFLTLLYSGLFFSSFGFGKNKVQYENLEWQYNILPHFYSYFHQNQGNLPLITGQWIENAYTELSKNFGFTHKKRIPLLVFGSPTLFEQTNVSPAIIPEGVGGFTESLKNRIVVPFSGSYKNFRHVLHHELVHAFQFGILFDQFGGSFIRSSGAQLPLWFAEGSAEYLSSGWDCDADMFLMDRAIFNTVPLPGYEMNGYMAYKGGQSFMFFLASSRGDSAFHEFLLSFTKTKKVVESIENVYNQKLEALGKEWQRELKRIYWPEIGKRENIDNKGRPLTSRIKSGSSLNLKPKISPDGTMIAYYCDAKDYTKIFISDINGKIIYRIGQYGNGGFFESFQPFRSGLCWSPKSDKIAFITKNNGKNEIKIVDVKLKKHFKTLTPEFLCLSSPDWSPDGKNIVFTGLRQNFSDLYLINIENYKITQLTNDIRYESDSRFSRDGKGILFTSRDSSGNANRRLNKNISPSDIYFYDIETKSISQITHTPWNEKEACFSPDGNKIAFISDENGINNIYIASFPDISDSKPVTNIIGGISNPDWSGESNSIVFSLFQNQGWDIWTIDDPMDKIIDSTLSPTLWVISQHDTSINYFLPVTIPPDSTDSSGISEIIDSSLMAKSHLRKKSSQFSEKDTDRNENIIDEGTAENKDSNSNDTITSVGSLSQTNDSQQNSSDIYDIPAFVNSSIKPVKKDSTPIIPKDIKEYPYKLKFSVDMVSIGAAYNTAVGYAGQGVVVFSDLLGNHQIAAAGNIQGKLDENNLYLGYINSQYRLDYGLGGFYDRYFTTEYKLISSNDSNTVDSDSSYIYHDTKAGGFVLLRYPFSLYSRVDLKLFYQHLKRVPKKRKNSKLEDDHSRSTINLNITLPSLSYVFDNILWGITGPINGVRSMATLLYSPPFTPEDASFISLDVDIRSYLHINRRFVWANRLAFGFSEPINRDESKRHYFLGGNENWIFWDINRELYEENLSKTIYSSHIVPFRGWDYFDITGVRYALLNTE
ncbi:MAG: BamA/TamA family outer membrane protein, partial [Chitinispirillia bacterium]